MNCPRAALFDLDDTLAESFQPPEPAVVERLRKMLDKLPVAILTAAGMPRIQTEILDALSVSPFISRMFIFPNSAAQCYVCEEGAWRVEYNLALTPEERSKVRKAIEESVAETGILGNNPKYEPVLIDREAQIAYACIGLHASQEDKASWDPDRSKRIRLKKAVVKRIPEFEILIGGYTTLDITRKGINKSYGVEWLSKKLDIPASEMLYVGDALYEGGNDSVVIPTGIRTRAVSGPPETARVLDELLAVCGA